MPHLIDRLLESPHYGERWGRYWLDIARYADTKGYVFTEDRNYPFAYRYRDWVVQSLNEDLPYDQFLIQQLAADLLPRSDDHNLAAMGFLTLGRRFLNNRNDIIDDRLDVIFRGTQALTVTVRGATITSSIRFRRPTTTRCTACSTARWKKSFRSRRRRPSIRTV